jgi:hypothetical protein
MDITTSHRSSPITGCYTDSAALVRFQDNQRWGEKLFVVASSSASSSAASSASPSSDCGFFLFFLMADLSPDKAAAPYWKKKNHESENARHRHAADRSRQNKLYGLFTVTFCIVLSDIAFLSLFSCLGQHQDSGDFLNSKPNTQDQGQGFP